MINTYTGTSVEDTTLTSYYNHNLLLISACFTGESFASVSDQCGNCNVKKFLWGRESAQKSAVQLRQLLYI